MEVEAKATATATANTLLRRRSSRPLRGIAKTSLLRVFLLQRLLLLLLAGGAASTVAKRPASFVAPTRGSAHTLTLSTVVTDAAELHFAVVASGHAPLDARAIKSAVEQCSAAASGKSAAEQLAVPPRSDLAVVAASTVPVAKAQKVERCITGLQPNTSYDVYFVAEVSGSNGVFGPVQSVLRSTTHPEPPTVEVTAVRAVNASATALEVNATMSAPGRVYFALVPSAAADQLLRDVSSFDLANNRSLSGLPSAFALHDEHAWTQLAIHKAVEGLTSATLYDVLFVSEALGGGHVRSNATRLVAAARTHALPPDVARLACAPKNASAEALVVDYELVFDAHDATRVSAESLPFFAFNVHYTAARVTPPSAFAPDASLLVDEAADEVAEAVRGTFAFGNFTSVEQLRDQLAAPQRGVISGLLNGTSYRVTLVAETVSSHGLVGKEQRASLPSVTHERAPRILSASAVAANGSVTSLVVMVELARRGNVHYLVVPRASVSVRHNFRDAPNMAHLAELLQRDESEFVSGVILVDRAAAADTSEAVADSSPHTSTFVVAGLRDATAYTVVVMPETHGSHGVFGRPFEQLLEVQTNENASEVALHAVEAMEGSTTRVELTVEMSKPNDVFFYCLSTELPLLASKSACLEANKESFRLLARGSGGGATIAFEVANLTADAVYYASVFAENALRNDVLSAASSPTLRVKTHKRAPTIESVVVWPVAASTDSIAASVIAAERCLVHYAIIEAPLAADGAAPPTAEGDSDSAAARDDLPPPETIVKEKWVAISSSAASSPRRVEFVSHGRVFAATATARFGTAKLKANTTYIVFVTTETSLEGNASGVYGDVRAARVTTFAAAPKIVKATVDPVADRIDSVFVSANLSAPGVVHYFLSDVDFADPAAIRRDSADAEIPHAAAPSAPHTLRGEFSVSEQDMAMEIINGTNDSQPVQPLVFVSNMTVGGLRSGATYHVSLTTETHGSDGVFGDFPPPILVTTHLAAPTMTHLAVVPKAGSSSSIAIELELNRFGEVHYALFFRELVRDHSDAILEEKRRHQHEEDAQREVDAAPPTNATTDNATEQHVWPPAVSAYELADLNASLLKAAPFDVLGRGVWENGTISVSREDVATGRRSMKEIKGLPPNAVFDVCLVSETAGSDGVFDWNDSARACRRVKTHADYSNQSILMDEISVQPVDGQTGSVRIELVMSKLPGAPLRAFETMNSSGGGGGMESMEADEMLRRFEIATGRTPYFILADAKEARKDFTSNSFSPHNVHGPERFAAGFREAVAGTNNVAAAGMLASVRSENALFVTLVREIRELQPNHPYLLFFAYETSGSGGVFTKVNPHTLRSSDSKRENDGIEVTTHEAAPALTKFAAVPTFGNTTRITVKFDVVCASCTRVLVHALVYPKSCARPSTDLLRGGTDTSGSSEVEDAAATTVLPGDRREDDGDDEDEVAQDGEAIDAMSSADRCRAPLARRTFVVEMRDREHKMLNVERDIVTRRMRANATYAVFLATETAGSNGVLSDRFVETAVTTFAPAPAFKYIRVAPRKGSTTEIVLEFELETPGEVHYMCGVSGNAELNVTSPYNVSRKTRPEKNAPKLHDYARDVVRTVRSVSVARAGTKHIEVLDYLVAGTSYDVFVVAEAPESNGVYSSVLEFPQVATHANPPILLAHAAHPTPGSKASLTVGFRVDAPGVVHFSVVETTHWHRTQLVARASDVYGNRLAIQEQLVAKQSVVVDAESMAGMMSNSGWREANISVPRAGTNYTVYLVTETAASDGVFGTVASHRDVRSHGEPPTVLKLAMMPTDARVDALTGFVQLTGVGYLHYLVLQHRRRLSERDAGVVAQGVVEVVASSSSSPASSSSRERSGGATEEKEGDDSEKQQLFSAEFIVEQLTEGTVFDLYFRCETLQSFGVFSSWTHFPISARTHGLPPDVLEEVECIVSPSCDSLGREVCTRTPNVCGECREGFSGVLGSSNEACVPSEESDRVSKKKSGATIKISGVRVNPLTWLEPELQEEAMASQQEEQESSQTPPPQHQEEEPLDQKQVLPDQEPQSQVDSKESEPPVETTERLVDTDVATVHNQTQQRRSEDAAHFPVEESVEMADALQTPRSSSEGTEEALLVNSDGDVEQHSSSSADPSTAIERETLHSSTDGSADESASEDTDPSKASQEAREDTIQGVTACPLHAHMVAPGHCECMRGFEHDELTSSCKLLPESAKLYPESAELSRHRSSTI